MRKRYLAVAVAVVMAALTTMAQSDVISTRFKQLDTNADGKLSADELKTFPQLQARLQGADANRDGLLTLDEVRAHFAKQLPQRQQPVPEAVVAASVREGPRVLPPSLAGVGRQVPNATLTTLDNRTIGVGTLIGSHGLVIAVTNTTCPIGKKYGPTLAKLESALATKGIPILYVNPMANESPKAMADFLANHKLTGPYISDREGRFAKTLNATTTTEVFLLDPTRTVVYRGAIDDQYGLGYSHEAPRQTYLLNAVNALLAGREANPAATTAPGCELDLASATPIETTVTYHNRISRIVQANCLECHHTGGVAPFSLERYEDVTAHAGMIRKVVENRTMPPWFASAAPAGQPSHWANDRTLSESDRADLFAWLKSDRPAGNPKDAPRPRAFESGWLIGKPDAVFQFAKPESVNATGVMPYQRVVVETNLTEDKWVKAMEVRPSARDVVHHVLVFLIPGDRNRVPGQLREEGEEQGFFAAYVPGQNVWKYPDGYAKKVPKGSRFLFQMHYTPNGTATVDRTSLGLVFADEPPRYEVKVAGILNKQFAIPPGAAHHEVSATLRVPFSAIACGFMPHMHLRGKAIRYEIAAPNGKPETVLDIPRYDFNWQLYYRLAEPRLLTPGSTVTVTGWFDNSPKNPANPDATKTVRWGPQTTDEMLLGYLEYFVPVTGDPAKK